MQFLFILPITYFINRLLYPYNTSYIRLSYEETTLIEFNGSKLKIKPILIPNVNRHLPSLTHTRLPSHVKISELHLPHILFFLDPSLSLSNQPTAYLTTDPGQPHHAATHRTTTSLMQQATAALAARLSTPLLHLNGVIFEHEIIGDFVTQIEVQD